MKIKLISDLHLEFCPYKISYSGEDILIIAGDIGEGWKKGQELISEYLISSPAKVIFVTGNHEYFNNTMDKVDEAWKRFDHPNFYFLQNESIVIEGLRFFGSTMWTDLNKGDKYTRFLVADVINDYRLIKGFTTQKSMELHIKARESLRDTLAINDLPMVVVTHHLPTYKSINESYKGSQINPAFASTDMDDFMKDSNILLWCHGHTHTNCDYIDENVRVVCNPRGYVRKSPFGTGKLNSENPYFDENLVIEVEVEVKVEVKVVVEVEEVC